MPVPRDSDLVTISIVVTRDQDRRVRARRDMQTSKTRRVSISEAWREVVEVGLESISRIPNMISTTNSRDSDSREERKTA